MSKAHFKASGVHLDGAQAATITIDRARGLALCRPLRRSQVYCVTLGELAELIAWRHANREAYQQHGPLKARRRRRA